MFLNSIMIHLNKYIILGGKGFIGRNLCDYIVRQGHEIEEQNNILKMQLEVIDKKDEHIRC